MKAKSKAKRQAKEPRVVAAVSAIVHWNDGTDEERELPAWVAPGLNDWIDLMDEEETGE